MQTGFELTQKAQEALLFAEYVAWSQGHKEIEIADLKMGLDLQRHSISFELKEKIKSAIRELKSNYPIELFKCQIMAKSTMQLQFKKIPFAKETQKILCDANLFAIEFCELGVINTGYLYLALLLKDSRFISLFENEELENSTLQDLTIKWIEFCSGLYLKDSERGDDMTAINIRIFEWLRSGNLSQEILSSAGLSKDTKYSAMPYTVFGTIEDDYQGNYAERIPPLKGGARDKARRDLDIMDSFVSASNLPEAEPDLLGIYMINQIDYFLFFEDGFQYSLSNAAHKYEAVKEIQINDSVFEITFDNNQTLEMDVPGKTEELPDAYNLYQFIDSMKKPQPVSEIHSDLDLISFFKRQNEHLDLYDRLIWKLENEMGLRGIKPDADHIIHYRFLALLYTKPFVRAGFLKNS